VNKKKCFGFPEVGERTLESVSQLSGNGASGRLFGYLVSQLLGNRFEMVSQLLGNHFKARFPTFGKPIPRYLQVSQLWETSFKTVSQLRGNQKKVRFPALGNL
jgi:hypothetical protein